MSLGTVVICFSLALKCSQKDLKPENFVFADPRDEQSIKLTEFGLALRVHERKDDYPSCGSLLYRSPEMSDLQFRRDPAVMKKADAYSFGILLYTMIFGLFPAFGTKGLRFPPDSDPSPELKELLKGLTQRSHVQRLSLHEALSHPWITGAVLVSRKDSDNPL
eukprot:TRINITY_DN1861_c0_g1_i1.p2 TRINITY_DN1861_c0_g1~~TRINITY_DN1861_c0_g1_i1.p2  ORF type:complete len:163 (-),score=41.19 TRINITY_DN1861_c0_g1_i1:75-563(-)